VSRKRLPFLEQLSHYLKGFTMRIFAGGLSPEVTEDAIRDAFKAFGQVESVTVVKDRTTNVSKGFGFIEMPVLAEATAAIAGLHGKEMGGKALVVNEARPKGQR
jgi:RNA recognition motif-containing protein